MALEDRLKTLLSPRGAESKRMFGGTCFMVNGNMVIGTFKDGLLVRVGKEAHAGALKFPGASAFEMQGRTMKGYVMVEARAIGGDAELEAWVDRALAFVHTLPPKTVETRAKASGRKTR